MIERFNLPREDWNDDKGRIYKDALVENFNAIESKAKEMKDTNTDALPPKPSKDIELEDVSWNSPDNKIINLKSFIDMMNLRNFPIELVFKDDMCKRLCYWNWEYEYMTITNVKFEDLENKPYIYLDPWSNQVTNSDRVDSDNFSLFIGCYTDNKIVSMFDNDNADTNLLYYLADMPKTPFNHQEWFDAWTMPEFKNINWANKRYQGDVQYDYSWQDLRDLNYFDVVFLDVGRENKS